MTAQAVKLRTELYPFIGRRITGQATFTRIRHIMRFRAWLLKNVQIGEDVEIAHMWIVPEPYVLKQVRVGERFSFEALVVTYVRKDGTEDCGLTQVKVLDE